MERIAPSSPVYQEVARLHRIANEMRPGSQNRWNGELYARTDDKWGGLARDGTLRLSGPLVLRHLTGSANPHDRDAQAQALATVLHESYHARVELDAPDEPNAVRRWETVGLDEGLTELQANEDFAEFAERAGYHDLLAPAPEYAGAVHATRALLSYATETDTERDALALRALDAPCPMRWDVIADEIVRTKLHGVVPPDDLHQQAARAELVTAMATPGWDGVQDRPHRGPSVAADTERSLESALGRIRQHHQDNPNEPYPAVAPNQQAATRLGQQEQARLATSSVAMDPAMRMLSGQAPAAGAVQQAPSLGDGSRRSAAQPSFRRGTERPTGRDDR